MWKFIWLLTLETALSDEIFTSTYSVTDQCIGLCKENQLPLLDLVILSFFLTPIIDGLLQQNYEQVVCQRGCRFFNIIHFKDELNLNVTRKECHLCRYLLHRFRFTKRLLLQLAMSRMLWLKKTKSACKAAI
jgi:hypothetical protein